MGDRILVTYASWTGSTASVAEEIGKILAQSGCAVDVLPMKEVRGLAPYRAVVAGSAIHGQKWLPEAMQFLRTYQAELAARPFAAFLVCITLAMKNGDQYRPAVSGWMEPVRTLVQPVSEGLFPGMLEFNKLPLTLDTLGLRLSVAAGAFPRGDQRDWAAVRAWAASLVGVL